MEGREILRAAQGARARATGKSSKRLLAGGMMKVKAKIKKDPLGALEDIEKKLDTDPYNIEANNLLYEAFNALGMPELAAFGLHTIREGHPDNTKNLHKLGDYLDDLDLADDTRARVEARIDADDFVDELVPFVLALKEVYVPDDDD